MEILAVFNAKGGVAKTTTAVNLATCFAALGQRVLIFDLDSQGNATSCFGISTAPEIGTYDVITGRVAVRDAIHDTFIKDIKLIAATKTLAAIDLDFLLGDHKKEIIRSVVQPIKNDVDIIVLDCPPAFGSMTVNALVSADAVLIPSQPTPFSHEGLLRTWTILCRLRSELNRNLAIIGILPTFIPENLADEEASGDDTERANYASILSVMNAEFGDIVCTEGVPLDLPLFTAATSKGVPACVLSPEAPSSVCYLKLAARILRIGVSGEAGDAGKETKYSSEKGKLLHWIDQNYILDHNKIKQALGRIYKWRDIAKADGILAENSNVPPVNENAVAAAEYMSSIDASEYPSPGRILNVLGLVGVVLLSVVIAFLLGWRTGAGFF